MLIAEDLLLLLTDDRTGKLLVASNQLDIALGGALLLELALEHRVSIAGDDAGVRKGRLHVESSSPTTDPLLDEALRQIGEKQGKKPKDVVPRLSKRLRSRLHARLAEQGLLHEETVKILGIVPADRWPSTNSEHEDSVRAPLEAALRTGGTEDRRLAALIALLHALKAVTKVIDPGSVGLTKQELNASAKQIAEGDWAAKAVREAIDAMLAIVAASSSASVGVPGGG